MVRVLQLISPAAPFETRRTADLLLHESGFATRRVTVGRGGDCRSPLALARAVKRRADVDVIHAFGVAAITTAAVAAKRPVLGTLEPVVSSRGLRWLGAVMNYRPVQIVCGSDLQHRAAVLHAIPADRCLLIRPGVQFARLRRRRDPSLRHAFGFTDDDVVLLAPGESDRAAGHERAAWVASILHVLDPRFKLLLWGPGARTPAVASMARRLHQPKLLSIAERRVRGMEFESLLGASDLALVTPAGAISTLPILTCMAAGVPIVATTTRATAEMLEDRHTAWMTTSDSPRELARRVLDVRADPSAAWAYADRARSEAFDFYAASRLLSEYRPALSRLAEETALPSVSLQMA